MPAASARRALTVHPDAAATQTVAVENSAITPEARSVAQGQIRRLNFGQSGEADTWGDLNALAIQPVIDSADRPLPANSILSSLGGRIFSEIIGQKRSCNMGHLPGAERSL